MIFLLFITITVSFECYNDKGGNLPPEHLTSDIFKEIERHPF